MRKLREKTERWLLMKKSSNLVGNWRGKIKRWGWLFDRFIVSKKPPNLIRWFEEEKPTFLNKTEQTNNLNGQEGAMWENEQKVQFFLARLLALLSGRPCFRLVVDLAIGLTVSLAMGGAELMDKKVTVGFSGWSLWNNLINFLRCWIAEKSSQVFFSLR